MVDEVAKHLDSGKGVPVTLLVYVEVKNDRVDDFLRAMAINAGGSRLEEGCYRFDVLRDPENPCKFTFYEAYENEDAFKFHKTTTHFKAWADFKATGGVVFQENKVLSGIDYTY